MLIEVFGPGCPKCNASADAARRFLEARGIEGEVVKRTELSELSARGVFLTPAVYVDGEKVLAGRQLREKDLEAWLADRGG
jgi:small redox-active disulfide protein 2